MARLSGFHCLAPDLPGFGYSNELPSASFSQTADLVATLIERHLDSPRDAIRMVTEAINESPGLLTAHEQLVGLVAEHGDDVRVF